MFKRSSIVLTLATLIAVAASPMSAQAAGEPSIARAVTGDDGDGHIDHVTLTFTTVMDPTTPSSTWFASSPDEDGFYVTGYSIIGAAWTSAGAANTALKLSLTPLAAFDTGATPSVRYRQVPGGPRGAATSSPLAPTDSSGVAAIDGAGPVLSSATATDPTNVNLFNAVGDRLVVGFSEPVLIAGAGPVRVANLEAAFRFIAVTADGANGCTADGSAVQNQNLPQQGTGPDPVSPGSPSEAASGIVISMNTGNTPSARQFVGVPRGCSLGVDPSNTSLITDAMGNASRAYNAVPGRSTAVRMLPAPVTLIDAATTDGVGSTPDGIADGIKLIFNRNLADASLDALRNNSTLQIAGVPVQITGVGTSGIPGDGIAAISAVIPPSADASDITIGYQAPSCTHAASGTTTTGAYGPVLYGPPFAACVSSFSSSVIDGVGPAILSAQTLDSDGDGRIDGAAATFSEPIATSSAAGWMLGGVAATAFEVDPSDARQAVVTITPGTEPNGGSTPAIAYTTQPTDRTVDGADNEVPTASWPTSDGVGPAVVSAIAEDLDGNGDVDKVTAVLSEAAQLTGTPVVAFGSRTTSNVTVDSNSLIARFTGRTRGKTQPLTVSAGIADLGGTPMTNLPFVGTSDLVRPTGTIGVAPSAPIPAGEATVRVIYTEDMVAEMLDVTLGDETVSPVLDADHTNGWRNDDPAIWEGSFTVTEDDCTVSTGCSVTIQAAGGRDLAGLTQNAPITLQTAIDTVAPAPATIASVESLGAASAPDSVVNSATRNISVTVDVPNGEAEGGTVEVLVDGGSMNLPLLETIPSGADTVKLGTSYPSSDELQAALGGEGEHALSIVVCDSASNCATGPASTLLVDTVGVEILLEDTPEGLLMKGGATQLLSWQTEPTEDPVSVTLAYTKGGDAWTTIASGLPTSGDFMWTAPSINSAWVQVRAISRDASHNLETSTSAQRITIDSAAPKINKLVVPGLGTVRAGRKVTVAWQVVDMTIAAASKPIVLTYSTNGGRTYRLINDGKASTANDGRENWLVPKGSGSVYLRLTATDGVGHRSIKMVRLTRS